MHYLPITSLHVLLLSLTSFIFDVHFYILIWIFLKDSLKYNVLCNVDHFSIFFNIQIKWYFTNTRDNKKI